MDLRIVDRYLKLRRLANQPGPEGESAKKQANDMLVEHPQIEHARKLAEQIERDEYGPPGGGPSQAGAGPREPWYADALKGIGVVAAGKLATSAEKAFHNVIQGIPALDGLADVQNLRDVPEGEIHVLIRMKPEIRRFRNKLDALLNQTEDVCKRALRSYV